MTFLSIHALLVLVERLRESVHTYIMNEVNHILSTPNSDKVDADVYASLVRLLAAREHSQAELRRKLLDKGFAFDIIEKQLHQVIEANMQSDQRYAEMSLRVALSKGHGPNRLKQKMQQHEIDNTLVSKLINSDECDWYNLAYKVKLKKFGEHIEADWKARQKQQRFLQGRGFTFEQINFAVSYNPALDA